MERLRRLLKVTSEGGLVVLRRQFETLGGLSRVEIVPLPSVTVASIDFARVRAANFSRLWVSILPWHEPLPLSKSACVGGWRFMEKWFSGSAFAAARDARRCSGFVPIAIADNAIAARRAAPKPGAGSTGRPTAAISRVPEGRLDHRDRQQQYRERRCRPRVTDQSSLSAISPAPFGCGETIPTPVAVALRASVSGRLETRTEPRLRCSICGRPGRFVDPLPHIPLRR